MRHSKGSIALVIVALALSAGCDSISKPLGTGTEGPRVVWKAGALTLPEQCPPDRATTTAGCMTCEATLAKVQEAKQRAKAARDVCQKDDECVLVGADTGCMSDCMWAIRRTQAAGFRSEIAGISKQYCSDYEARCVVNAVDCADRPACVKGRCTTIALS